MARRRQRKAEQPKAPEVPYEGDGAVLVLRGAMTPKTREQYRRVASGEGAAAAASRDDTWQRAVEYLFERLAVRWEIAGTEPLTTQKELLARFRFATAAERGWIRDVLRAHLAEHFPELPAP
ncbi:MAG TPA: hypothetical protein VM266_14540 [Solirubrobacteraceae bacterium]|nr:hypothetical protein [Solirubrobacteraceae bacterium]